jgi:hypothetical protein
MIPQRFVSPVGTVRLSLIMMVFFHFQIMMLRVLERYYLLHNEIFHFDTQSQFLNDFSTICHVSDTIYAYHFPKIPPFLFAVFLLSIS